MNNLLPAISNIITHIISTLGYPGVGFLMALQTVAVPIPSEVILPFAGYLASLGRFNILIIAVVGGIGSCIGSSIAYYIGDFGGRALVHKYGKYLLISLNDLNLTEKFFARFGSLAVFVGQLLPIVRSFMGFASGLAKEDFKKFLISVFVGSFLWSWLLAYVGEKLGQNWQNLHSKFQHLDLVVILLIIFGVAFWIYKHTRNKK
jgi:membrane protein DedA with SNARE-associated domain